MKEVLTSLFMYLILTEQTSAFKVYSNRKIGVFGPKLYMSIENLIECSKDPLLASSFENMKSTMCAPTTAIDISENIFQGLLMQLLSLSGLFLIYFLQKRRAGRFATSNANYDDTTSQSTEKYKDGRNCPQCNGTGYLKWNPVEPVCDLCDGTGILNVPIRESYPQLPKARAAPLWENGGDDNIFSDSDEY